MKCECGASVATTFVTVEGKRFCSLQCAWPTLRANDGPFCRDCGYIKDCHGRGFKAVPCSAFVA